MLTAHSDVYSIVIEVHPDNENPEQQGQDWRLGDISVDWVDLIREKSSDRAWQEDDHPQEEHVEKHPTVPGAMTKTTTKPSPRHRKKKRPESIDDLSLQPLLAHIAGPNPFEASSSSGVTHVGNGVVHLFKHAPPASLIARLEGQNGEGSSGPPDPEGWADENAEGGDGSLIAILAVPAWMRPADLIEFLGGWAGCLEGVRMIRLVYDSDMANHQRSDNPEPVHRAAQVQGSTASLRLHGDLCGQSVFDSGAAGDLPSHPRAPPRPPSPGRERRRRARFPAERVREPREGAPEAAEGRAQVE